MIKHKISDIADAILKKSYNEELPYIEIGDIDVETKQYIRKDKSAVKGALKAKKDHVLISKVRPTRGAVTIITKDCLVSNAFVVLQTRESIIPKYLIYSIAYNKRFFLRLGKLEKGTSYPSCRAKDILTYKISLFTISKQKEIIQKLDTANNLRQKRKEQLALLDDYLKSVFLDMFGDYLNSQGKFIHLEKLTKKISVGHVGPTSYAYTDRGIPFLRTQNIKRNFIDLRQLAYVNEDFHKKLKKSQIHTNDVLISRVGVNRGIAAVVLKELDSANCANVIIVGKSEGFNSIFLSAYLNFTYGRSAKFGYSVGSAQGVVNTSIVKKWPIIDVNIEIQNKFASIVEQVEKTKQKMRDSLEEMDNHFNALMQRYFE